MAVLRSSRAPSAWSAPTSSDVPPLRARREDIPELLRLFVARQCSRAGRPPLEFQPEACAALLAHDWPGNLRELENLVERLVVLLPGPEVAVTDLPPEYRLGEAERGRRGPDGGTLDEIMDGIEKFLIVQAIRRGNGVWKRAAELLGLKYSSLIYKIDKHGLR